ncbi:MAG: response regulator [Saprospirales bacterium]|nr:MAG: response regulator [Saprospirales bacterium]
MSNCVTGTAIISGLLSLVPATSFVTNGWQLVTIGAGVPSSEPLYLYSAISLTTWIVVLLTGGLLFATGFAVSWYFFRVKGEEQAEPDEKRENPEGAEKASKLQLLKNQRLNAFIHEMRSHMSIVIEPVRNAAKRVSDPSIREKLKMADESCVQMLNTLNHFEQLSNLNETVESGIKTAVDLKKILLAIADNFMPILERKGIDFRQELPGGDIQFLADSASLKQVFYLLFSNAVNAVPTEGKINAELQIISIVLNGRKKLKLAFHCSESYCPNSDSKSYITTRFSNTDLPGKKKTELLMAGEILEKMGGNLKTERPDEDSLLIEASFFLDQLSGEMAHSVSRAPHANQSTREAMVESERDIEGDDKELILVVEDNADLRNYIRTIIEPGYRFAEAEDGTSGLKKAIEEVPDLIVTDLMMPGLDGLAMTRALRKHEISCHIPVLILTAKVSLDDRLHGLRAGADCYLTKPFHARELLTRIESMISNRKTIINKFEENDALSKDDEVEPRHDANFIKRINSAIDENIMDENLGAELLSKKLFLSRMQLYRKLKAVSGHSASIYIRNYRLEKARSLLVDRKMKVGEVSLQVGFSSPNYFSRKFSEKYGIAPSKFRKKQVRDL